MADNLIRAERLAALERERAERVASLPKHSIPAALLVRLEELDDQIAALRAEIESAENPSGET